MKTLLFFLLSLFYLQQCDAQRAVVAHLRMNVAYIGVFNDLRIAVPGYNCDEFEVTTDNGEIERSEEDCTLYHYLPLKTGYVHIIIKVKRPEGKIIDSVEFRVRDIPNPTPRLGGYEGGILRKKYLLASMGMSAGLKVDFDFRFIIQKYSVAILRNNKTIFTSNYTGPYFSDGLKEEFKNLKQGDKLLFYDITTKAVSGDELELSTMEFTIIEE
jgi:hypothetical protein